MRSARFRSGIQIGRRDELIESICAYATPSARNSKQKTANGGVVPKRKNPAAIRDIARSRRTGFGRRNQGRESVREQHLADCVHRGGQALPCRDQPVVV